ncbi:hypothetical protein BGZ83_010581 [Gryganskiella cystojenkinii]|nr:hypothetical protein BGZ83_010581 [Gryganskiella cystojenkinii]
MPRQDYSLPSLGPLPKLAAPVPPKPKCHPETDETDLVMVESSEPCLYESKDNGDNDNSDSDDDEYDMIEDEAILKTMLSIVDKVEGLSIAPTETIMQDEVNQPEGSTPATHSSLFVDSLLNEAEGSAEIEADPNMTTTANGAPTFISTGDVRLDFFFEVLRGTDAETIKRLVHSSWESHPLDTLKLIFQLRSILHGKGERKEFYTCLDYLRKQHPRTLLFSLRFIPDHGYWKDLLNWLVFECREDHEEFSLNSRPAQIKSKGRKRPGHNRRQSQPPKRRRKTVVDSSEKERVMAEAEERNRAQSIEARKARLAKTESRLEQARTKFRNDTFYRALHLEVARLFANALVRDKARMERGQSISLAAKWCPSLNQFHDEHTLIASTIAQILFPDRREGEDTAAYVNRARAQLRQEYYVPLRKATPVLETLMTSSRWDEIEYKRVPARAMKTNKVHFESHDKERFEAFLNAALKGETTIAAQSLMPHDLVTEAWQLREASPEDLKVKTMEAQWKSYVERLGKTGTMNSTMAVCDVSGSMSGTPMEVAIALSLLLAQLSQAPFNQLVLTFSATPQVHRIPEGSLVDQVESLRNMDWGYNTNLGAVFDHILQVAVKNKIGQEQMVKTLFIFSDMEFDSAISGYAGNDPLEPFTNYNVVKSRFESAGYVLPQIVFWNLAGSSQGNKPAKANQKGIAMVSGFSGMLMKLFLDGVDLSQEMDPVRLMEKAIGGKEYSRLKHSQLPPQPEPPTRRDTRDNRPYSNVHNSGFWSKDENDHDHSKHTNYSSDQGKREQRRNRSQDSSDTESDYDLPTRPRRPLLAHQSSSSISTRTIRTGHSAYGDPDDNNNDDDEDEGERVFGQSDQEFLNLQRQLQEQQRKQMEQLQRQHQLQQKAQQRLLMEQHRKLEAGKQQQQQHHSQQHRQEQELRQQHHQQSRSILGEQQGPNNDNTAVINSARQKRKQQKPTRIQQLSSSPQPVEHTSHSITSNLAASTSPSSSSSALNTHMKTGDSLAHFNAAAKDLTKSNYNTADKSKTGHSDTRVPHNNLTPKAKMPRRQYKKTILRQQAAVFAAQLKDENEARDAEATRRVLAQVGVFKQIRSLRSHLEYAQYKVGHGLEEQPLHMVSELFEESQDEEEGGRFPKTGRHFATHTPSLPKISDTESTKVVVPTSTRKNSVQSISAAEKNTAPKRSSTARSIDKQHQHLASPVIQRRLAPESDDEETDSEDPLAPYEHQRNDLGLLSSDESAEYDVVAYRHSSERRKSHTKLQQSVSKPSQSLQLQQQQRRREQEEQLLRKRHQQQLQQQRALQEREKELLAKQKRLEERQLQHQHEQRLRRERLLELHAQDEEGEKPPESYVPRRPLGLSNSSNIKAVSMTTSATSAPKKKKPSNPIQRAPTTENILATVRSPLANRTSSNIVSMTSPTISASVSKGGLLGSKRMLSNMEDKENRPIIRQDSFRRECDHELTQNSPRSPVSLSATYKRQRPASSPIKQTPFLPSESSKEPRSPLPAGVYNAPPAHSRIKTSSREPTKTSVAVSAVTIASPLQPDSTRKGAAPATPPPSVDFAQALISALPEQETPVNEVLSPTATSQKEFLNCFDQWMSDLGTEDLDSFADTPATTAVTHASGSSALPTPTAFLIPDQFVSALGSDAFLGQDTIDTLSGQEDVPEMDDSEIDQLLYSEVGEDYGVYSGQEGGGVDTPGSEFGAVLENLSSDLGTPGNKIYDWFSETGTGTGADGAGGATSIQDGEPSSSLSLPTTPYSLVDQHLSLLSTDPILSSSPAEMAHGLEFNGLEGFDPIRDPLWLQQELQLQSSQGQQQQQLSQQVDQDGQGLSSSRGGTPCLVDSASSNLLSSALSEMLSSPMVQKMVASSPASTNHYVPMGLSGQPLDLSNFDLGDTPLSQKEVHSANASSNFDIAAAKLLNLQ